MSANAQIVRPTELVLMAPGERGGESLVFVKGYMSERYTDAADSNLWVRQIRAAGWPGAIYQLRWDSGRSGEILRTLGLTMLLRLGVTALKRRLFFPMPPLGVYELNEIRRHWTTVSQRANVVDASAILDLIRHEMGSGTVTLVGHSLGAKIAFNMLRRGGEEGYRFKDAILLGGALSRYGDSWRPAAESVDRTLLNVHHGGDWVLRYLYKLGELTRNSPCGLKPIVFQHGKIRNTDASPYLPVSFRTHVRYPEVIEQTAGRYLWEGRPSVIHLPANLPASDRTNQETSP